MKEQGYMFPDELHEVLKGRLLSKMVKVKGGFKTISTKSTTELTKDEFTDYIDRAEKLLSEYCGVNCAPFWADYANNYMGE